MLRFRQSAVIATASLIGLAGCGGAATKNAVPAPSTTATTAARTPLEMVLASSEKVADVRTMRFAMTMSIPEGSFTGEGAMDSNGPLMSMTMDMASLIPASERKDGTTIGVVLNDQAMYIQVPGLAELGGKRWMRFDLATLTGNGNPFASIASQLRGADPRSNFEVLEGARDVVLVGHEGVRGVPTDHYHFTIDLNEALQRVPETLRNSLTALTGQLGPNATLPGEVWLDADGLPRRFAYDVDLSQAAGKPSTMRTSMEMFDFGQPVQVSIPPESDIIDSGGFGFGLGGT